MLHDPEILKGAYICFQAHDKEVTDLSLAPDGNVMCTASHDGKVVFWDTSNLVNAEGVEDRFHKPKSLHEWYFISCNLFFLSPFFNIPGVLE